MAEYKEMYAVLFQDVAKAITILQEAQKKCEEIYMSGEKTDMEILLGSNTESKPLVYPKREIKQKPLYFD